MTKGALNLDGSVLILLDCVMHTPTFLSEPERDNYCTAKPSDYCTRLKAEYQYSAIELSVFQSKADQARVMHACI
jgi:hypothetical protein